MKNILKYWTIEKLKSKKVEYQRLIDNNDGRLTAYSSYDLDYYLDWMDDINGELIKRGVDVS